MRVRALITCGTVLVASGAIAAPTTTPCGTISSVGCCHGEVLLYCKEHALRTLDCRDRPSCGWRKTGRYDCGTSGSADPAGKNSKLCIFDKKERAPVDAGTLANACGKVTEEGCCYGNELRLCINGSLRKINCDYNRFCGWRGVAQAYNCGTEGKADPRGKFARNCEGAPDSGPLRFPDAATQSPAKSTARSGCGCTAITPDGPGLLPTIAIMLLMAWRRRQYR